MLVKLQNKFVETDDISYISTIKKYDGKLYFEIILRNKTLTVEFVWVISHYIETEEILKIKMDAVRNEIVKLANKSDVIIEIGRTITVQKKEEKIIKPVMKMAAKKAA